MKERPTLAFYHANAKGTGCAVKFELHPAHDFVDGCIFVRMANQKTLGNRLANPPVYPLFDWDDGIAFKLAFADVCEFLRVFRGECESIQDGKGLYVCTAGCSMRICLRHMIEPIPGYSLEACCAANGANGTKENKAQIFLSSSEALGLCLAFERSMPMIAFGVNENWEDVK